MFIKYQHVEKLGTTATEGIIDLEEPCYIFPKIDGTNGQIWKEGDEICYGSRNRKLGENDDNQGFVLGNFRSHELQNFFTEYPGLRLYGEWLVPHTLKTYNKDAWRKFYVFDVCEGSFADGDFGSRMQPAKYWPYNEYKPILDRFGIEYIPPIAIIERATEDQLIRMLEKNVFLMQEGEIGEGVVVKRYGFVNKYGRTVWAKIVRNDFKTKHTKEMGAAYLSATDMIEEKIVEKFLPDSTIEKAYAKIVNETGSWESKLIPRLLSTVFRDLVTEEIWEAIKAFKNPKIDFKVLNRFVISAIKKAKPKLF